MKALIRGNYSPDNLYPSAMVNITNFCNLSCRHCFVFRDGNPNEAPGSIRDEMSHDDMLATLSELRDRHQIRSMMWMGGEPLLKPELLEEGIKLFERNTITTNGTAPLVDFGRDVLYVISLDGPPDLNDAIRGAGVFKRVMRNLDRLPDDFASAVQVQCVVTKVNQHRLDEFVESLLPTKVGWMTFSFLVPTKPAPEGAITDDSDDTWATNEERMAAVDAVLELKERYGGFVRNSRRSLELMAPTYAEKVTEYCPATRSVLPLYLEGDHFVTPFCCYGNDVDCSRCGAWAVFQGAARLERSGTIDWDDPDSAPG